MINKMKTLEVEFLSNVPENYNSKFVNPVLSCENGDPINLVFVHGSGCNRKFFKPIVKSFLQKSNYFVNCYLPSLPSHGKSDDTGFDTDGYVSSIKELIKNLDNVVLVGHSLGGVVCLEVSTLPNVIGSLIISSGAKFNFDESFMEKVNRDKLDMLYVLKCCGSLTNPNVLKALATCDGLNTMLQDFKVGSKMDVSNILKDIKCKTRILVGGDEILTVPAYSKFLTENIKDSSMRIVKGFKHMMLLSNIPLIVEELNTLIKSIKLKQEEVEV